MAKLNEPNTRRAMVGAARPARRHVFLFKPRFAPLVRSGEKSTTIRPTRKRVVQIGDILDLRTWSGLPYRSKQLALREARCVDTGLARLDRAEGALTIHLADRLLSPSDTRRFAHGEGFESVSEMLSWFETVHGLPFTGIFYAWDPRLP